MDCGEWGRGGLLICSHNTRVEAPTSAAYNHASWGVEYRNALCNNSQVLRELAWRVSEPGMPLTDEDKKYMREHGTRPRLHMKTYDFLRAIHHSLLYGMSCSLDTFAISDFLKSASRPFEEPQAFIPFAICK